MSSDTQPPVTLLTFGPMVSSETTRRLLDLYGVPFKEERHLYLWASIVALFKAGTVIVPLIMRPGLRISAPRPMADHFDALAPENRKLIPGDPAARAQVEADWTAYYTSLATSAARIAYYHLLPQTEAMIAACSAGVTAAEASWTPAWYGPFRWLLSTLFQFSPASIAKSLDLVRAAMDDLEARIADGREFLVEERPTLSDVALAGAMWPLIMPEGCTAPVPTFEQSPPAFQAIVTELRGRPGGRFINQLYGRLRERSPA